MFRSGKKLQSPFGRVSQQHFYHSGVAFPSIDELVSSGRDRLPVRLGLNRENPYGLVDLRSMIRLLASDLVGMWPALTSLYFGYVIPDSTSRPPTEDIERILG